MVDSYNLEIGDVFRVIVIAACELPLTVMMPGSQFYAAVAPEDMTTDDGSCFVPVIDHGRLNPVGPP